MKTLKEIAAHVLRECIGDNCECCNWSQDDYDAMCGMTLEVARVIDGDADYQYEDNMTDVEADADTLASAGWGTDEDYGYFGGED